jgi:uncharacterized membrane protein
MKLFMVVLLVFGFTNGLSVTNYTVSKSTYEPGDIGLATITVVNPTGADRATGLTMTMFSPTDMTITGSPKLADIDSGGTAIVSIPFKINSDAKPGIFILNVDFDGFSGTTKISNTASVPITVADLPLLTIDAGSKVLSGVDVTELSLSNNGGPANQMRLSISNATGIGLFGTNEKFIGKLEKSVKVNITLDARSADDGPVNLPVVLLYTDELGATHAETLDLRLTVKKEKLDIRFNQLSSITTREEGTLQLEVVNNGEDISDVRISFTNESFRLTDSNEIKLGDLASGEKTTITAKVWPELTPGLNLVEVKLSYIEKDVSKEQTMNMPLTITSDSDVGVYLESKPSPLVPGVEHTVSVLVSNLGSYGIDNVDVGLESDAFTPLDITPRQYIGSLEQDDFSTVQFKVMTNGISGEFPININVQYRDSSGEWVNKTITQNAKITTPISTGNGALTFVIVIVAIAAILIWYFKFRKKD